MNSVIDAHCDINGVNPAFFLFGRHGVNIRISFGDSGSYSRQNTLMIYHVNPDCRDILLLAIFIQLHMKILFLFFGVPGLK